MSLYGQLLTEDEREVSSVSEAVISGSQKRNLPSDFEASAMSKLNVLTNKYEVTRSELQENDNSAFVIWKEKEVPGQESRCLTELDGFQHFQESTDNHLCSDRKTTNCDDFLSQCESVTPKAWTGKGVLVKDKLDRLKESVDRERSLSWSRVAAQPQQDHMSSCCHGKSRDELGPELKMTVAVCDKVDDLTQSVIPEGEGTVYNHGDNILHDSVSSQEAGLVAGDDAHCEVFVKDGDCVGRWGCGHPERIGRHEPDTGPGIHHLPGCCVMMKDGDAVGRWGCGHTGCVGRHEPDTGPGIHHLPGCCVMMKDGDTVERWDCGHTGCVGRHEPDTGPGIHHLPGCCVMMKDGDTVERWDCGHTGCVGRHEPDTGPGIHHLPGCCVMMKDGDAVGRWDCGHTGCVGRHEPDTGPGIHHLPGCCVMMKEMGTDDGVDCGQVVEILTSLGGQSCSCPIPAVRHLDNIDGDGATVFSQKERDVREAVEGTEVDMDDLLCQRKKDCDIQDIVCTEHAESVNVISESDRLCGADYIHVADMAAEGQVQGSYCEKVISQKNHDDVGPGKWVLMEGDGAKEDIADWHQPTFIPQVSCRFGNHGKSERCEDVTPFAKDVEYCKDVEQCLIPRQPAGVHPIHADSDGIPGVHCPSDVPGIRSGVPVALSNHQVQGKGAVSEEKTGVSVESHEQSVDTVTEPLISSTLDSDGVQRTDDQHVADQVSEDRPELCNEERSAKPLTRGANGDDNSVCGEEATSMESGVDEADVCVSMPVGMDTGAPSGDVSDIPVVCEDSQNHFDLSDAFDMFAEDELLNQLGSENNDQCVSSEDVSSVVNVRQNAVSARAKKRKKQKAKLEKQLSRNTTSRAARVHRYAASFQELLDNKEDAFHPDFTCPVCLDLYHKPHVVHPCRHMFCEPCLRKLPSSALADNAVCPLCRHDIRACVMDVDLHIQLSGYYVDVYTKRARLEKKLKTNQKPLPRIQTTPLSQQLIRQILSSQSNRRTDGNVLHIVLSVCLSAVISVLYVWMNIPIEITSGRLRNAAVSNVWVQAICLFCVFVWLFLKALGTFATRERR
ncbi:uncharacterized protein LOC124134795 [Haliotis rufescens]|uniref:uncharacterized protein LOC124134795 n=1 Tax=Haliotis rufescens TaxID=6454 RepID=UPI00201F908C|nr:uncharacterized protein LOC124134795 [Haliotis rufescens]